MIFDTPPTEQSPLRNAISAAWLADESTMLDTLLPLAQESDAALRRVSEHARRLVNAVREKRITQGGLDAFLHEYDLSSQEGVLLMCLAEALLRIPDAETADRLIHDKLSQADWQQHLGHSESLFVNASTWGLMLTGRIVRLAPRTIADLGSAFGALVARSGEPVIRLALKQAMRIIGHQFVMGQDIDEALLRSRDDDNKAYRHSYDMLGEAALTDDDAQRYFAAYQAAIAAIGSTADDGSAVSARPGISVKLSALHPRYEFAQRECVLAELSPRLLALAQQARALNIGLTVDAEEAERLELSLDIFERVLRDESLAGWAGFGLAVQAYQKRALAVIDWLIDLAQQTSRRIPLRLVKGAYWDSEIKRAQERGLSGYPVFTRKINTDVSYLACARRILAAGELFYPQFATHNARTVASIIEMAGLYRSQHHDFEFQRLHGMGEALYAEIISNEMPSIPCRVYAPVGSYHELLPYLVRRLLENGANTSFVNRIENEQAPVDEIIADPVAAVAALSARQHPRIPLPEAIYGEERKNASGVNLYDESALRELAGSIEQALDTALQAAPIVAGRHGIGDARPLFDPADRRREVGTVIDADAVMIEQALASAYAAFDTWRLTPAAQRADILERAAGLFEQQRAGLVALCLREGGKTIADALAEHREAVDYCRYYAAQARKLFGAAQALPGPTGEGNELSLHGRGVFVCISPWNFPLAIFSGQITAALAAGNTVIAKPATQTPLVAMRVIELLHQAGIPGDVLHLLPGGGKAVGMALVADTRTAGVVFTGSTETAQTINRTLAQRDGPLVPLIAETGGQNCMIVDSSALPEQVTMDVINSAFNSAGQRCSALRVLYLQQEIAPRIIELLQGAMGRRVIGDPALLSTDIGPVIDEAARQTLQQHAQRMQDEAVLLYQGKLPEGCEHGSYFAPHIFEIGSLQQLPREVFGPILHIIRYRADKLDAVIEEINNSGYGLTLGIHSRIEETARYIQARTRAGNCYVNRNMIGAVVGVQPFGGEGLSGTGPKAGGPHYLQRFAVERTYTVNTAAVGGNATLLSLGEE